MPLGVGAYRSLKPMGGSGPPPGYSYLYDADLNVYKDAGTTPAANNDTVQQWNNQASGTANMKQATAGSRPTYKTNQVNGHAAVSFDGVDDTLTPTAGEFSLNNTGDCWTVLKLRTWHNLDRLFGTGIGTGTWAADALCAGGSPNGKSNIVPAQIVCVFPLASYFLIRVASNLSSGSVTINNNAPTTAATGTGGGTTVNMHLGSDGAGTSCAQVDIAYQITYSSVLSGGDVTTLQSYLGTRFGLF